MLQQDKPDDFVIATGESHSVREFVEKAFHEAEMEIAWEGTVEFLLGDPTKAKNNLGWQPEISFDELVSVMMREDILEAQKDQLCQSEGFATYNNFE